MGKWVDYILQICNWGVALLLVFSKLAGYINPNAFIIPSYLGLAFPILVIINIIFAIYWIYRFKATFFIPLFALLFSAGNIFKTFPTNDNETTLPDGLKIVSYNTQLLDFYKSKDKNKILQYLIDSDADIICLQEFGYSFKTGALSQKDIDQTLGKLYPYSHKLVEKNSWNGVNGLITYSKFRIISQNKVEYTSNNKTIYSDILYRGDTLRVFNCHLESNKLTRGDKLLIKKLGGKDIDNGQLVKQLYVKMGNSYRKRSEQAEAIADVINSTHYPTIVCGDFNDVIISYSYQTILGDLLKDAHTESGFGYNYTYHENGFFFKIDHILHSKEISSHNFMVDRLNYSDHYPIRCTLTFPNSKKVSQK